MNCESAPGDDEDSDVAPHRVVLEGRLLVHQVRHDLLPRQGRLDDVAHESRVVQQYVTNEARRKKKKPSL